MPTTNNHHGDFKKAFSGGHVWKLTYFRRCPRSLRRKSLSQNKAKAAIPFFSPFQSGGGGGIFFLWKALGVSGKPHSSSPRWETQERSATRLTLLLGAGHHRGERVTVGSFFVVELFCFGLGLTLSVPRCVFPIVIHKAFGGCYQQFPTSCTKGIKIFPSIIFQSFNTRAILSLLF